MSDRMDAVLANIDQALTECICGNPIPENGPSPDYCSPACQRSYTTGEAVAEPYPYPIAAATDGRTINEEVNRRFRSGAYTDDPFDGLMRGVTERLAEATRGIQIPDIRNAATFQRPVDRYTMGRGSYHNPPTEVRWMPHLRPGDTVSWTLNGRTGESTVTSVQGSTVYCAPAANPAAPTAAELADGVDLTPYLVGIDADDPRHEIQAGINQMHQDLAERLGCSAAQVRSFTEYLGHQISAASDMTPEEAEGQLLRFIEDSNPPDPPTPEEFRRRALEARRNRNTGPQRHDHRRWRNT